MIIIDLSRNIIKRYVEVTTPEKVTSTSDTVYGTVVSEGDTLCVKIDGSSIPTPVSSTIDIKEGDRVLVLVQNHEAMVIGSPTAVSARMEELRDLEEGVSEFETVLADKIGTEELVAVYATIEDLETKSLSAESAVIKDLQAETAKIKDLDVESLEAGLAVIKDLDVENLEAAVAKIEDLDVENLEAEIAKIKDLDVEELEAALAVVENLEATYADIEFANIGEAAIEKLFADSGIIKDLVMKDGYITGELTAVTLNADLIKAGTLTADRLVLKGTDGLYYQLNSSLEGITAEQLSEQEYQEALHGDNIIAHTITADRINVSDLVAFDATIGGWVIDSDALRTAGKGAFDSGNKGTYLGSNGSFGVGNNTNYITFDPDTGKIKIQADEISIGVNPVLLSETEEYYSSTSPTSLSGGSWSTTAPTWSNGKYIWRRTVCNYADGSVTYNPSQNGVCITGNTGSQGNPGTSVSITNTSVQYCASANGTTKPQSGWSTTIPSVSKGQYLWTMTTVTYSNGSSTVSYSVSYVGTDGSNGNNGKGVSSVVEQYYLSTSNTSQTGGSWGTSYPGWANGKYLWTRSVITYTDNTSTTTTPICVTGATGSTGSTGKGVTKVDVYYYLSTSSTALSGGSWSTTAPTWVDGKYIWSKTITTYTDGTTSESTAACITGGKGATGSAGNGVQSSTVTYQASTSGTTIPTGTWSTSIPSVSAGSYLWTKTVLTFTNGTTQTSYSVGRMGNNGSNGDPGADGKMLFGTCSTIASTAKKSMTITGFSLYTGVVVAVQFTYANTAANPSLNVSSTGDKAILLNGSSYSQWLAGAIVNLVYDGTSWQVCSTPLYGSEVTIGNPATYNVYVDGDSVDFRSSTTVLGSIRAYNSSNTSQGMILRSGAANVPQMSLTHQGAFMYASNTSNAAYDNAVRCWYSTNGLELYSNTKMSAMVHNGDLNLETYYGGDIVFRVGSDDGNCTSWSPYHRDGETLTVNDCRTSGFVTNSSKDIYFMVPLTKPVISGTTAAVTMSVSNVTLQLRQNGNYTHGTTSAIAPSSATAKYVPGVGIHMTCSMSATTNAVNNAPVGVDFKGTFTF